MTLTTQSEATDAGGFLPSVSLYLSEMNAYLHPICEIQVQIRRCLYLRGLQGDQVNGKGYE